MIEPTQPQPDAVATPAGLLPAVETPAEHRLNLPASREYLPRNYLARKEQRRIFWLFMPPALIAMLLFGWVERTWFGNSPRPARPQVDTTLSDIPADPNLPDAVVIEAEPELIAAAPDEYGATPQALSRVRDDTVFRGTEDEAWFQIWLTLRSADIRTLAGSSIRPVSFPELFGQPKSYRGRLVRFRGTLHRLEKMTAPANDYDIHDYWQGWLEPEGGPASPIVVYFLRLPTGMPHGMKISEPVDVVGYFFKRWAYAATDAVRIAPLVLALEPLWKPRPSVPPAANSIGNLALLSMAALVLITMIGIRVAGRGAPRRPSPAPADLSATLSDVELHSTEDALRRLAEADRMPTPSVTKDRLP